MFYQVVALFRVIAFVWYACIEIVMYSFNMHGFVFTEVLSFG